MYEKKHNERKDISDNSLATIPLIAHEYELYKAKRTIKLLLLTVPLAIAIMLCAGK